MRKVINVVLSTLKYIIALFMMYAGIATMFAPVDHTSKLGFIYESRPTLVGFGLVFFASGLTLLIGKLRKKRNTIGHGLMAIYLEFLFAAFLNWYALGIEDAYGNMIAALIVGALYLRWKYHIYYTRPLDHSEIRAIISSR